MPHGQPRGVDHLPVLLAQTFLLQSLDFLPHPNGPVKYSPTPARQPDAARSRSPCRAFRPARPSPIRASHRVDRLVVLTFWISAGNPLCSRCVGQFRLLRCGQVPPAVLPPARPAAGGSAPAVIVSPRLRMNDITCLPCNGCPSRPVPLPLPALLPPTRVSKARIGSLLLRIAFPRSCPPRQPGRNHLDRPLRGLPASETKTRHRTGGEGHGRLRRFPQGNEGHVTPPTRKTPARRCPHLPPCLIQQSPSLASWGRREVHGGAAR